jgi:hypothetical protein
MKRTGAALSGWRGWAALSLLYAAHVGIRSVFYLAIIPGLLAFCTVLLVKERNSAAATVKVDIRLRHFPKDYWKFLVVTALLGVGNSSNAFLILRTQDIDASLPTTIAIYAGYNLVAALIAYVGFAVTQNVVLIAGLFVFYGLYQGIFRTAGKSVASSLVPDRLRASGIGWYSTTLGLLQLVASVIAGLLWDRIGHVAVFYYGAVFAAVGIVALLLLIPGRAEPRAEAA